MTARLATTAPPACRAASDNLLAANIEYGYGLGWSFTPLTGKRPTLKSWPTLPRETLAEALAWAAQGNVGLRTGAMSGVVVIDADPGADLAPLDLPATITARTGRDGQHLYYRYTRPVGNSTGKLGPHIDVRGDGGQVVYPGSIHPETGRRYEWAEGLAPWQVEIAELPRHILERLNRHNVAADVAHVGPTPPRAARGERYAQAALEGELGALRAAPEGNRNETLNKSAFSLGQLAGAGLLDRSDVEVALESAAEAIGLPQREAAATIRSGLDSGVQHPRQVHTRQDVETVLERAGPAPDQGTILIDTAEHRVVAETVAALAADPDLYQRGGMLVRILRDTQPKDGVTRPAGSPTIQALPPANLRERMTRFATFVKFNKKGEEVLAHPAAWLVAAVDVRADWPGIRHLAGVSDAPVLRADGSIWQTPGYDRRTGVLFETSQSFPPVPDELTIDDASAAVDTLLEVVCDFPFEAPEHRAAWLAGLLTPLARFAFEGPAPLFLVDANIRAAGKGLLAQTIARIVLGRDMPVSSYAHEDEEMRKRVTSIALAGDRLVLLDNLEGLFGNATLSRALTACSWKDRLLGCNQEIDLPLLSAWYATGNNVSITGDVARRTMHVRLDVLDERPEGRMGFRHPNLLAWIGQERPRLLAAALTLLVAFCRAGRPSQNLTPYGSFEGWSDLVRQALVWSGQPDPHLTQVRLVEVADVGAGALREFLLAWKGLNADRPVVLSQMLAELYAPRPGLELVDPTDAAIMRAAIENLVGGPAGKTPSTRALGNRLRGFRRRVMGGQFLDIVDKGREGAVWRLCGEAP